MPAAAVIPAPIAYTKVVAIKKLVVGSRVRARGLAIGSALRCYTCCKPVLRFPVTDGALDCGVILAGTFTLKKLECSKQAMARIHCME